MENKSEGIVSSVLDLIGNTPLLALDRIWPGPGRLLAKCEFLNPTGSLKDRSALAMIVEGEKLGLVKPEQGIVEYTSGNQGCALACVSNVTKHKFTAIMSKGNSEQRRIMLNGLGANLILVDQVDGVPGSVTGSDLDAVLDYTSDYASKNPDLYLVDQFQNKLNSLGHYQTTGPEIWKQTNGNVDAFLMTLGTSGCFAGVSKYLKEQNPKVKTFAVEPEGCQPAKGLEITKPRHLLQGSGYTELGALFKKEYCDDGIGVSDEEVLEVRKRLGKEEGLFLGFTAAANVAAAINLLKSKKLGDNPTIVTILCDTGLKVSQSSF